MYFEAAERMSRKDPLDDVRRAFKLFDDDSTGKITVRNLRRVCKELGENLDEEEMYVCTVILRREKLIDINRQAMIDEFDLDCDGEINEEEFVSSLFSLSIYKCTCVYWVGYIAVQINIMTAEI